MSTPCVMWMGGFVSWSWVVGLIVIVFPYGRVDADQWQPVTKDSAVFINTNWYTVRICYRNFYSPK